MNISPISFKGLIKPSCKEQYFNTNTISNIRVSHNEYGSSVIITTNEPNVAKTKTISLNSEHVYNYDTRNKDIAYSGTIQDEKSKSHYIFRTDSKTFLNAFQKAEKTGEIVEFDCAGIDTF